MNMMKKRRNNKRTTGIKKFSLIFFSLWFFLFVAFLSAGICEEKGKESPRLFTLNNGMKVILLEDHSSPVVALDVWVNIGSAYESEDEAGLSHVFEHMLFKGTEKRGVGEVAKEIEATGGDINAFTSYDNTVYYVVTASRYMDTALDVLSDAVINSAFDPKELKNELKVVLEEYKMRKDIPEIELHDKVFRESFRVHNYGRLVIGYEETIKGFTRGDLLNFYQKWYVPENMFLVAVGDFESKDILPKIENLFGKFERKSSAKRETTQEPEQKELRSVFFQSDVQKSKLSLIFHAPEAENKDSYALDVLALILGQGQSSRLFQKVKVEQELVNSIYSYVMSLKDPGVFSVGASLEGKKMEEAYRSILAEIDILKNEPVSVQELAKAKLNLKSDFIYKKETMQGQARSLGSFQALFNDFSYQDKYLEEIDKVSKEDIMRVARKYLRSSQLTVGILLPQGSPVGVTEKGLKSITAEVDEKSEKSRKKPETRITRKVLGNGITLLVKENHSVPIVSMRAVFLGGVRFEDGKDNGVSHFVSEMLTKGTQTRSARDIAVEIESIAGSLSGFSGRNSIGVESTVLSHYFNQGIELFADVLLHPSFDQDEMEKKRREIIYVIQKEEDDLIRTTAKMFLKTLFQKHPYGMPSLGTVESVSSLKEEDLRHFYQRCVVPSNMVLSFVGDVKTDETIKRAESLFGSWPSKGFKLPVLPEEPPVGKIRTKLKTREKKQTHILLGFLGTSLKNPDRYPLEVLSSVLSGQGGRLFIELRDKESLAYSVASFNRLGIDPEYFGVYIATSPEKEETAIAGIMRELKKVREAPVTPEELERAKKNIIGGYEIGLQTYSSQAADMAFNEIYGLGYDNFKKYPQKILKVTADDLLQAARKYIDLDAYVIAVTRPE